MLQIRTFAWLENKGQSRFEFHKKSRVGKNTLESKFIAAMYVSQRTTSKGRHDMQEKKSRRELSRIMDYLVTQAQILVEGVYEGYVNSKAKPYRRLDCDAKALAYCRLRPRLNGIRVDVSGLWVAPPRCSLSIRGSTGAASLFIREMSDVPVVINFLRATLSETEGDGLSDKVRRGSRPVFVPKPSESTQPEPPQL